MNERRSEYQRLKHAAPADRRLDYAFALVLINEHHYPEAERLVAGCLAAGKAAPNVHCTEIWLLVQLHRYVDATQRAVELAALFSERSDGPPQPKLHDAADFLGAVFGYLELVCDPLAEISGLSDRKVRVLEALGEIYRSAFDAGLKDVGARLAELKTAQQADEDERLAKAAQVKKEALAVVEKDTSKIESQRTAIQASAEQLQGARAKPFNSSESWPRCPRTVSPWASRSVSSPRKSRSCATRKL